jgi:hypothetical protein
MANVMQTLKSGRKLEIQLAPFKVGRNLYKTVFRELKLVDIDLENMDLAKLQDIGVEALWKALCQLEGSEAVDAAVWQCLAHCVLHGVDGQPQRISDASFEGENDRGDFLNCHGGALLENLRPFFRGLDLKLLIPEGLKQKGQASKSTPTGAT